MAGRMLSLIASQQASVASLGSAALLAFVALVGLEGWRGYDRAAADLETDISAHALLMSEHVDRTLQTVEIVFDAVQAEVGSRAWDEIAGSRIVYQRIRGLADSLPQIRSIWLTDQNGGMRLFSERFPSPELDAFDREYFQVHALQGVTGLFPGRPMTGKFTGKPFVPVSMPLVLGGYSFRGVVTASVEPDYYLPFLTAQGHCAPCTTAFLRPDGEILFSTAAEPRLDPALVDGVSKMIVSDAYPIVVAVWAPKSAVLGLWWAREKGLAFSGLAASLLLTWLLLRAVRSSRAAAREQERLRDLAEVLVRKNEELNEARSAAEVARGLEKQLREAAAAANVAKSQFLALMSHELRTPMNAIIGFSEIIRGEVERMPPAKVAEYAEDIHASGSHLLSLINDILDLSKIEAGKFEIEEQDVELQGAVEKSIRAIEARFSEKNLTIERRIDDLALVADARAIRQILFNLLSNAGKFSEPGGRVVVSTALQRDWVCLTVADEGCGMSPEDLERAMLPFGQAAAPLARRSEGTGLGLNITQSLVELHGGRLEIDSAPGRGCAATVLLPRWRLLPPASMAAATLAAAG